jgi:hypothetical protein
METAKYIRIKIAPERLNNPDLYIRYVLPNLIVENSEEFINDVGYDYTNDESNSMLLYFEATDLDLAVKRILEVINTKNVLDNDLKNAVEIEVRNVEIGADLESGEYQSVYKH